MNAKSAALGTRKRRKSKVSYKPEYCADCAKKMGEDPNVQRARIILYFAKNYVEKYERPVCRGVIKWHLR